jgi:hypothetical protein
VQLLSSRPNIQYGRTLTYPTLKLYYAFGNKGIFLNWLNYVTSWPNIPLAGSRLNQQTSLPRTMQRAIPPHLGQQLWCWVGTTITHGGFVWSICFPSCPQPVRLFSPFTHCRISFVFVQHSTLQLARHCQPGNSNFFSTASCLSCGTRATLCLCFFPTCCFASSVLCRPDLTTD